MSHAACEKTAHRNRAHSRSHSRSQSRSRSRSRSATRERKCHAATKEEVKLQSDLQVVPEVKRDWADELLAKYPYCLHFDWGSKSNTQDDFARLHERKTPYANQPKLTNEQEAKFTLDQSRMFHLLAEWAPSGCAVFDPTKVYGGTYENKPVKIEYERRETWCIDDYDTFGYYTIHLHGKLYVSISRE